jgi:hypothetical protein
MPVELAAGRLRPNAVTGDVEIGPKCSRPKLNVAPRRNGVGPFSASEKFDRFLDRFPAEVSFFSVL